MGMTSTWCALCSVFGLRTQLAWPVAFVAVVQTAAVVGISSVRSRSQDAVGNSQSFPDFPNDFDLLCFVFSLCFENIVWWAFSFVVVVQTAAIIVLPRIRSRNRDPVRSSQFGDDF